MLENTTSYLFADVLLKRAAGQACLVEDVRFRKLGNGEFRTKLDALRTEVSGIYSSRNLDELIKNSYTCSQHLQHVGLFVDVKTAVTTSSTGKNSYVVDFFVKEPPSLKAGIKMEMTMAGQPSGNLMLMKESIFGRGESADFSFSKAMTGYNFNFSACKPLLGWNRYSNVSSSAFHSLDRLSWNKSELTENGLILQYTGQLWKKLLAHSLKLYCGWRFFQPLSDAPFPVREHAGHTTKISVEHAISMDRRNRPILPSSGFFCKYSHEHAGLLGDSSFMKHQIDLQAAAPLLYDVFVGAAFRAAIVQKFGEKSIHLLDRVYLGGPYDLRGFELNSLGTRADSSSLGGAASFATAFHIYKPLVPRDSLFAHAFVAAGNVCSVRSRDWFRDVIDNYRMSTGVGLTFVYADKLRFELNYVHPLKYVPGDAFASSRIQFGFGVSYL